ncbi:MAG: L-aspartate oxidase [Desulfomonilia bacterium]|jgi:L-aspartate oxidase|uniref:L-aspartate oxidase n=1 Tax=anaerobic digester metagenome TaxID=1263854 RepID=A0A485LV27_9ZZZZ|nr:FAD-dependent oxidoreductase [Pseudomonadota bacterium]HON38553.1 FAD-dependent oxidoreductase [Deltaproteobacteria bacterium]HRS56928.1 FAD-dependent oxidoreductase [Desulfomonilia bacterium]HPD20941.1 FAD-dependent oxidoreductase [Deltaproteobacteria bacterium]HPX17768.1 FAD-dependent oxidoreductase [Deltaproteobacteria bacterium]
MPDAYKETECLIIGTGIAGATCAYIAAKAGVKVCLLTKRSDPSLANTNLAQGGIVYSGNGDSPELLKQDILKAGRFLNSLDAVDFLSRQGPAIVKEVLIDDLKVDFTHLKGPEDESYDLTREGAHSINRILYSADHTGQEIEKALLDALRKEKNVELITNATAIDLITLHHHSTDIQSRYLLEDRCAGAYVFKESTKEVIAVLAQYTVLATGGLGDIYLHSTNEKGTVGDGIVMAKRAGANVINMEFIQFHPTTLYLPGARRFLLSEALRGEGARLMNLRGEYFMDRYNPELKDLAPRDEVAIAIWDEMIENKEDHVLLDIANFVKEDIPERFPKIYSTCKQAGIDITREPVPVVPAAHYFCGGVHVNNLGRTTLNGLYAAGEVSCTGLHGANRLASTSLLEGLVWGYTSAKDIVSRINSGETIRTNTLHSVRDWIYTGNVENEDPALIAQDWASIKSTMWNYVGIVRTRQRLKIAIEDLRHMLLRIEDFYRETPVSKDIISLFQGTQSAILVADAAFRNRNSIGCHFLRDHTGSTRSYPAMPRHYTP